MALGPTDPQDQKKLVIGLVPILLLVGYWYFMYPSATEQIDTMEARLESLERNNNTARAIAAQGSVDDLEKRLALYRQHISQLERLIPNGDEVPELLEAIATSAQNTHVELALMRPDEDVASDFYRRVTYEMGVIGHYHDVADFLTQVGSLSRIVTPIDLILKPQSRDGDDARLEASFRIETYVLPQDSAGGGRPSGNA